MGRHFTTKQGPAPNWVDTPNTCAPQHRKRERAGARLFAPTAPTRIGPELLASLPLARHLLGAAESLQASGDNCLAEHLVDIAYDLFNEAYGQTCL